jgi:CheY-like chemotaxis protein
MSKQSHFLSGFVFNRKDQRVRRWMMLRIAGVSSLNFLAGCFLVVNPTDIAICLIGFVIFLLLAGIAHLSDALDFSAHSFIVLSFFSLATLISRTGGINSPGVVWMPTIAIAALLVINLRWSMVWLGIIFLHHIAQFLAVQNLWITADVSAATITPINTLWVKLNLAIAFMLVLYWNEIHYRSKNERLAARNHALSELRTSLQQTRDQIVVFVGALESQLRVPMDRVRLLAPITKSQLPTASRLEDDEALLEQASNQLLGLVDELGDLAKLESGQLVLSESPFDLREALVDAVNASKLRNVASDVSIEWISNQETCRWAIGDRNRLSRVVAHLLVQSMGPAFVESLRVRAAFNSNLFSLEIPQVHALDTKAIYLDKHTDTSGISQATANEAPADLQEQGLHERLVAMVGGRIAYEHKPDGLVLRLEWPMLAVPEHAVTNEPAKINNRQTLRVMVVGGPTAQQFEMQQTLNKLFGKCEFGLADSGETALVQLEFGDFDLVLIELQLPGMDGIETTRRIRTHSKSKLHKLIVVGLGNLMLAPQRKTCLDAGMQWVLFRPWTTDTLFRALKAQLGYTKD